jgi:hypothetical protein
MELKGAITRRMVHRGPSLSPRVRVVWIRRRPSVKSAVLRDPEIVQRDLPIACLSGVSAYQSVARSGVDARALYVPAARRAAREPPIVGDPASNGLRAWRRGGPASPYPLTRLVPDPRSASSRT